jgi:hypothetical protein
MTDEDRAIAESLRRSAADADAANGHGPTINARPFSIRGLAGRILKQD